MLYVQLHFHSEIQKNLIQFSFLKLNFTTMKIRIILLTTVIFMISTLQAQIVETHEFGETNTYYYIYSSGKTWEFTAENDMVVEAIETKSVLASAGGTFHIEVRIQGNIVANWDQYVNDEQFTPYFHNKDVSYSLQQGNIIVYKIYGNSSTTPTGGILGINYVKLIGQDSVDYDIEFSSLADMNYAKYGSGYTSDGNNIYSICGGLDEAPWKSRSIEKYDIAFNTWTEIVNNLIPRRYCSAEFVNSQNKIYIFNGDTYTNTTYTDTVEIVDIMTGDLSYSATNPYPVEYGGSAVWNNKIYIFGGSNSSGYSNRLYEFDPSTESWTRLADMPEAKQTNGEIINGVLYVIGGYSGSTSKRIDAYDIQNSTWTPLGELPDGISAHATISSGKNIWLVGSYDNIKFLGQYNVETNSFTQLTSNMIGRKHCGASIVGDNLYIFGGNQSSNESSIKNLQYADISNIANAIDEFDVNHMILSHISPNPFTTSTTIEYELKEPTKVTLTIYNQMGKQVFQTEENQPQGKQQQIWNAERYAEGVYYYKLQVGDTVANGKMVKVR